tara:strand:+ start:75 stop:689 length:615 start_codon:yes stop_codon:yes gene_type:complete
MDRRFKYLWDKQVVYRRDPITDIPDEETDTYMFYKSGTYECYDLFRSKAKITTWRSFYWHMLVLQHLNPDWSAEDKLQVATYLSYKLNGFTTFNMNKWNINRVVTDIDTIDADEPPRNKLRKIIFKSNTGLTKSEKLSIVGKLIGKLNGINKKDIYEAMLQTNYEGDKIIISRLAKILNVTSRTIHRHMCDELKKIKQELNEEI